MPEVLADLAGPIGDRARRRLRESSIIAQLGGSSRDIRNTWGFTKKAMAGFVPESWLEWVNVLLVIFWHVFTWRGTRLPRPDILVAHDAVTIDAGKAQHKLRMLINQGLHTAHAAYLNQLPEPARPPGPDGLLRGERPRPSPRLAEGAYSGQEEQGQHVNRRKGGARTAGGLDRC